MKHLMKVSKDQTSRIQKGIIYGNFIFYQYNLSEKLIEKYKPSNGLKGQYIRRSKVAKEWLKQ